VQEPWEQGTHYTQCIWNTYHVRMTLNTAYKIVSGYVIKIP